MGCIPCMGNGHSLNKTNDPVPTPLRQDAHALVPPVVVTDELKSGILIERCKLSQLQENFYAITMRRRFAHPALRSMLGLG